MTRKLIPFLIPIFIIVVLSLFVQPVSSAPLSSPITPTPTPYPGLLSSDEIDVETAIQQAITGEESAIMAYLVYQTQITGIQISSENDWAKGWLYPVDPETGETVPAEPGLVLVKKVDNVWQPILPSDDEWLTAVQEAPTDILSVDEKMMFLEEQTTNQMAMATTATYGGYYLPWTHGVTMAMTQSVRHDKYTPSGTAHYAFDFATPGTAQMFNILASKMGRVKFFKDTCSNGDESCSNYIVLEDINTSPTTYQLYLHLAKGSIPSSLKVAGKKVAQGQIIGIADDTGTSTAHHLHFMVHTNATSYWGSSVDITFNDVSINGGRPRITADISYCKSTDVCTSTSNYYVSGNSYLNDFDPPQGGISSPILGQTISSQSVNLSGWAKDDNTGIASAQFIALYGGNWHDIGSSYSSANFSLNWNMCSDSVPDGPVSVALSLQDVAGNKTPWLPGLVHFIKNYDCGNTVPACYPSVDQISLFADPFYKGSCVTLDAGTYTNSNSFGDIGNNNVESILVGHNVMATLYASSNDTDRGETLLSNDSNLVDNIIGANNLSSIIVSNKSAAPGVPTKVWPSSGTQFSNNTSVSLVWDNGSGDVQYQARYIIGSNTTTSPWLSDPYWHLGSLSAGTYSWQVKAKNNYGESSWSAATSFTIQSSSTSPASVTAPFTDTIEALPSQWQYTNNWDLTAERNHSEGGVISWAYDTGSTNGYDTGYPNQGDLTSPNISIPASGTYFLRFWYYYETESPGTKWDQRWVQISVDGGAFTNTLQLSDDPINTWLQSPVISLAPYSGHTIRVRFHFETLDGLKNTFGGWSIDDFSVTATPPTPCSDSNEPNGNPLTAPILDTDSQYSMVICPGDDIDYFRFAALGGDHLGFYVQGNYSNPNSALDPFIALLDLDTTSPLAENDDQVLAQQTDAEVSFSPTVNGVYYLKIKAWDHPSGGGNNYSYVLKTFNESDDPSGSFIFPNNNATISTNTVPLSVSATDTGSGVSHVQFYWHSGDWDTASNWALIGEDWNGSDGWTLDFDLSQLPFQGGMAFYARIFDHAGNWTSTGIWNISNPDSTVYLPFVN